MATVKAFIRVSTKNADFVNIRFRLSVGRGMQFYHVSELKVQPSVWDSQRECVKAKVIYDTHERTRITDGVAERKRVIMQIYDRATDKTIITSQWLESEIQSAINPNSKSSSDDFFDTLDEYIERKRFSELRKRDFRTLRKTLYRYNCYLLRNTCTGLILHKFTSETLCAIDKFLREEYKIYANNPELLSDAPYHRPPVERGQNTINTFFGRLRSFFCWALDSGKITADPFKRFQIEESIYGTPIYITIDEREQLSRTNLSRHPQLAIQRDIFVFQCLIGCRVGDLYKMTKRNIIKGAVEYIASKTKEGRPVTVRVPLSATAKEILEHYPDSEQILPFISQQKYNEAIKRIFLAARLRRSVTILNPTTREPEIKPLNEVASSHMARRCFVGNLYKKVKDPNLIGALSGHREGSKAFARYRDIDEEIKVDLVNLLEK